MRALITIAVAVSLVVGGWFVAHKIMDTVKGSQAKHQQMMIELSR